jgi:hypothetical protein
MSYSFHVQDGSKKGVGKLVAAELDKVVASQPVHAVDVKVAHDAAEASVALLVDPSEDEVVSVSVSGSIGGRADGEYTTANVSVSVAIRPKPVV